MEPDRTIGDVVSEVRLGAKSKHPRFVEDVANITYVEHMPWFAALYADKMAIVDGEIAIPERPGVGFTFDWDALESVRLG